MFYPDKRFQLADYRPSVPHDFRLLEHCHGDHEVSSWFRRHALCACASPHWLALVTFARSERHLSFSRQASNTSHVAAVIRSQAPDLSHVLNHSFEYVFFVRRALYENALPARIADEYLTVGLHFFVRTICIEMFCVDVQLRTRVLRKSALWFQALAPLEPSPYFCRASCFF